MKKVSSLLLAFAFIFGIQAQEAQDTTQFEQVRSLLNFYEYMLNSIGSPKSSTRDKEVIIKESYKKIFESNEVQIEDNLLGDRRVITNKDVDAYLRDVDFFFKKINFDFTNEEVTKIANEDSSGFFLVSFESTINAISIEGNPYQRSDKRFMEINYNRQSEDLKIASIYSTKVSREKELNSWWMDLSYGWKNIFKEYVSFDSLSSQTLLKIANIDSLNLSGNVLIQDLNPLAALRNLRFLDISNTQIKNLEPLRYSKNLETLIANNSFINDLGALEYFGELRDLHVSNSYISDITPIGQCSEIRYLDISNTAVLAFNSLNKLSKLDSINLSTTTFFDLSLLQNNESLIAIDVSKTDVSTLEPLKEIRSLEKLDASETGVNNLGGLSSHPSISLIKVNRTAVKDLTPLLSIPNLKKVYADYTKVTEAQSGDFMSERSDVLVITSSEEILYWWEELPANWKSYFIQSFDLQDASREKLIKLINIDSLDISGNNFHEINPLKKFSRIHYLNISKNLFTSLEFTSEMSELSTLIGNELPVESTDGLEKNTELTEVQLSGSLVKNLSGLQNLKKLKLVYVNDTNLGEDEVIELLEANKDLVVVYQEEELQKWWTELEQKWKTAFSLDAPDVVKLHELIEQEEIVIANQSITSLTPLDRFINLKKVTLDNLRITNLSGVLNHPKITSLTVSNGPLQSIEGINQLKSLSYLNLKNTGIEDLKDLDGMKSIRFLNCAGTSIKNLKGISELYNLETLDVSNTRVWKLQRLDEIRGLTKLICYNTRLRDHTIKEFQADFPDCEIDFY